jgi:hypothetical protein
MSTSVYTGLNPFDFVRVTLYADLLVRYFRMYSVIEVFYLIKLAWAITYTDNQIYLLYPKCTETFRMHCSILSVYANDFIWKSGWPNWYTVILVEDIPFCLKRIDKNKMCMYSVERTALQTGRSRDRFPMVSMKFFIDIILPVALWPWGRLSL